MTNVGFDVPVIWAKCEVCLVSTPGKAAYSAGEPCSRAHSIFIVFLQAAESIIKAMLSMTRSFAKNISADRIQGSKLVIAI